MIGEGISLVRRSDHDWHQGQAVESPTAVPGYRDEQVGKTADGRVFSRFRILTWIDPLKAATVSVVDKRELGLYYAPQQSGFVWEQHLANKLETSHRWPLKGLM